VEHVPQRRVSREVRSRILAFVGDDTWRVVSQKVVVDFTCLTFVWHSRFSELLPSDYSCLMWLCGHSFCVEFALRHIQLKRWKHPVVVTSFATLAGQVGDAAFLAWVKWKTIHQHIISSDIGLDFGEVSQPCAGLDQVVHGISVFAC
jgi:hypothetical protein